MIDGPVALRGATSHSQPRRYSRYRMRCTVTSGPVGPPLGDRPKCEINVGIDSVLE